MHGKIKTLVKDKGFGFLRTKDGKEYFFHRSACIYPFDSMMIGEEFHFDPTESPKGLRAEDVRSNE